MVFLQAPPKGVGARAAVRSLLAAARRQRTSFRQRPFLPDVHRSDAAAGRGLVLHDPLPGKRIEPPAALIAAGRQLWILPMTTPFDLDVVYADYRRYLNRSPEPEREPGAHGGTEREREPESNSRP